MKHRPLPLELIPRAAASTAGSLLAGATRLLSRLRPSLKPLHPRGDVLSGTLVRIENVHRSGVRWLDTAGTDEVIARLSRAVGLPPSLPDVHGIAIRIPVDHHHADLLFASTGLGPVTRFLLLPGREIATRPLTTLLPYRGPHGPIFLGCRPTGRVTGAATRRSFTLLWSHRRGEWVEFARLDLLDTSGPDPAISFDPVANPLPGLPAYDWVRRLREPAYRTARDESGRPQPE